MPKDATKNVDRYKIRGGQLNEFDFHRNQEEFAEASKPQENLIPGTPPEQALPFLGKLIKKAGKAAKGTKKIPLQAPAKKTTKTTKASKVAMTAKPAKATKTTKAAKASKAGTASKARNSAPRGATAKKLAARKAAKK